MNLNTRIVFIVMALLGAISHLSAQKLKSLHKLVYNVVESKFEREVNGDISLNYYNNDFCDYYVYRINDQSYTLRPGKNTLFTKRKNSNVENPFKDPSSYRFFRGNFAEKFDIKRPYALPVKSGSKTAWKTDVREFAKTLNFYIHRGDTVYATRGGMVCKVVHSKILLIYHSDNTFAAYLGLNEMFFAPGEEVKIGQPVGTSRSTGISVSYFFLDENKFENSSATGYPYSHFIPTFRTSEGDVVMEEKRMYEAVIDDDLITRDMTKREKKKYFKNKKP